MTEYAVTPTVITSQIAATRAFYGKYFGATVAFDAGWYLSLALPGGNVLSFQAPGGGGELGHPDPVFGEAGLILNFEVADADAEYERLAGLGLTPAAQPKDSPFGFRAFEVKDPSGITLFVNAPLEQTAPEA